ncbi:hypothetical protein KY284_001064 [Solanum tuberosum]|nr:hypothetical protein KY284_001064 [Solanum tuberosum]
MGGRLYYRGRSCGGLVVRFWLCPTLEDNALAPEWVVVFASILTGYEINIHRYIFEEIHERAFQNNTNIPFSCLIHKLSIEAAYTYCMVLTGQINDDTNLVAQHPVLQQDVHGLDIFEMPTIDSSTALIVDISLTVANEKPPDTVPAERLLRFHLQPPD